MDPNTFEMSDLRGGRARRHPARPAPEPADERQFRGTKWVVICMSLYIPAFLYGLDTMIAAAIQGPAVEEFGHAEQIPWIGAGFPLGSICAILLLGPLFINFNMKYMYLGCISLFGIGSALCGGSPNMSALIVGRVIAGVGGNGIYLGSIQYLEIMTPRREREYYLSLLVGCWGVGCIAGPVIGGGLALSSGTWRWAFYLNLVLGIACVPGWLLYLPHICLVRGVNVREKLAGIDFAGCFLGSVMWVSFLLAITMGGGQWAWNDGRTIATLVVCALFLVLYALQQYFAVYTTRTSRAFPAHLLRQFTQVLLFVATAASTSATYVVIYYLPLYFQWVNDDNALMAGVRLLPFVAFAIPMSLSSTGLLQTIKTYKFQFTLASVCLGLGGGPLVYNLHPSSPIGNIYGLCILIGLGTGFSLATGYTVSAQTIEPEDMKSGVTFQSIAQIGGEVIALGVAGQVYRSCAIANLQTVLAGHGYSDDEILAALTGVKSTLFQELHGTLRDEAINAIVKAMQMTFVLVPVAGGMMFLAALCMKFEEIFVEPSPLLFPHSLLQSRSRF